MGHGKTGKAFVWFAGRGAQSVELSLIAKQTLGNTVWEMVGHAWNAFSFQRMSYN